MDLLIAPYTVDVAHADKAPATGTPGWATDGNPATNTPATYFPAYVLNALIEEITTLISGAGLQLDRNDNGQMLKAIQGMFGQLAIPPVAMADLPATDKGPVFVLEAQEIWTWSASAFYTGYRSPRCGAVEFGHTTNPLPNQVDAVGATVLKSDYPRLWAYAQENGLTVASGSWTAGALAYADLNSTQFRLPDLRNQFLRFTGTNVDTANARVIGSLQQDAVQRVRGVIGFISRTSTSLTGGTGPLSDDTLTPAATLQGGNTQTWGSNVSFDNARAVRTSSETRPANSALPPRLRA